MSFNPKVSIIVPVYNGSNYLREAIDSALAQTYKNIEVIVVNDGSNDGGKTEAIALSYGDMIRYFYKKNGGVASALNTGIQKAEGEYISWLSHDDLYYPNKIDTQVNYLNTQENKEVILFSNFDVKNYFNNTAYTSNLIRDFDFNRFNMLHLLFSSQLHGCSMLIPIKCFNLVGYFSESLRTTQDYEYFFKLVNENYIFHYLSDSLIITRHHKEQDTHRILDYHLIELNDLYIWAFTLFVSDFQSYSIQQLDIFLSLMKNRGIVEAYNTIAGLRNYKIEKYHLDSGNPIIWLYWENKKGEETPDIIKLCQKTIIDRNNEDFHIILTNPYNISFYLPNLNKTYHLFEKIAHRADYIRFNLLYYYGGIWLDSDFIAFKSLRDVLDKVEKHGFAYSGYVGRDGKIFPIIHFLGAKKLNPILKTLIENADKVLDESVKNGIQPGWDDIGGYALQKLINKENSFRYEHTLFAPIDVHAYGPRKMFFPIKLDTFHKKKCFGQMLPYSVHSEFFNFMGSDILKMHCYLAEALKESLGVKENLKRIMYNDVLKMLLMIIPERFRPRLRQIYDRIKRRMIE